MFIADVVAVDVDEAYMDEKDTFHLSMAKPLAYSHGRYYGMGEELGSFGVQREKAGKGCEGWQENFKISGKSRRCRESSKVCRRERRKESNYPAGTNQKGE